MSRSQEDPFIIIKSYNSQYFSPEIHNTKVRKPTVHSWTEKQNFLYLSFLKQNLLVMESKEHRKQAKIFKQMEKIITTRSSVQIKSHHQKLVQKHQEIRVIICALENQLGKKPKRTIPLLTREAETSMELKSDSIEQAYEFSPYSFGNEKDIFKRSQMQGIFFEEEDQQYIRIPFLYQNWSDEPLI